MKTPKIQFIFLIFVFSTVGLSAQEITKTGTTAAQFLKIDVGPRAVGMGGAFVANSDDATAFYWNPAGLASNYSREAYFNHISYFADINYDFAGFAIHIPDFGTVGTFVTVLSVGEMKVRTVENPRGTGELFDAGAFAIGVSYARNLTREFSIGINAKYIREHIWNESALGFALDIGTLYRIPVFNELRLAASISNFGTKMRMEGRDITKLLQTGSSEENFVNTNIEMDEFELPLLFRIGVAADVIKENKNRITLAVDAVHPNDHTEYINTGIEYAWNEIFYLRGGYKSLFELDTEQGLTLGLGINYRIFETLGINVDYAYQDFGRLTSVHYFALGIKF